MNTADAEARLDAIKAELNQWLRHCDESDHALTAIALLQTAMEGLIADLGDEDAALFVQLAFERAAARQSGNPMPGLAELDTEAEA